MLELLYMNTPDERQLVHKDIILSFHPCFPIYIIMIKNIDYLAILMDMLIKLQYFELSLIVLKNGVTYNLSDVNGVRRDE